MPLASANGSTARWLSEDFLLVKFVGESSAESEASVAIFGAVRIGEARNAAAAFRFGSSSIFRFGSGADSTACSDNFSGGNFCRSNFRARHSRYCVSRISCRRHSFGDRNREFSP